MSQAEDQRIPVMEIFGPTIQGEGSVCGYQTYFIRFGGCDYRCAKCDSMHAVDGESIRANATYMSQEAIGNTILQFMENRPGTTRTITFSGGNPLLWELGEAVRKLVNANVSICVETQGTYFKDWLRECDIVTVSPKSPGMGEKFEPELFIEFLRQLRTHRGLCIKIVIFSAVDLEFAINVRDLMEQKGFRGVPFYLSLGNNYPPGQDAGMTRADLQVRLLNDFAIMADDVLNDPRCSDFIFLPQLHVLAWGNKQGV